MACSPFYLVITRFFFLLVSYSNEKERSAEILKIKVLLITQILKKEEFTL